MGNIQEVMDKLQPYVIGIRYQDGNVLVDAVFKAGWIVPDDSLIKKVKGNEELNYYMIFSEANNIGLDDLLAYVDKTIKLNIDRETKHELLRVKVNELKEIFKQNTLSNLQRLKFTFGDEEEELMPSINELDNNQPIKQVKVSEETIPTQEHIPTNVNYLDEDGKPIVLSEEELELLEEEARAQKNIKMLESKKQKETTKIVKKVELPVKIEVNPNDRDYDSDCDCGPEEACDKCIDKK